MHYSCARSVSGLLLSLLVAAAAEFTATGLCLAVPAMAWATVITFDDLPEGTTVTNQYAEAMFSSSAGNVNSALFVAGSAYSQPYIICSGPANAEANCIEDTYIDFTLPVNNLTFWAILVDTTGVVAQFNIYENGALAASEPLNKESGQPLDLLVDLSAYTNVTRLEIVNIVDNPAENGIGWDSFTFEPVPEPGSIGLLGLGLLSLACWRRVSANR